MTPTIGRIVYYKLSALDVQRIEDRAEDLVPDGWINTLMPGQVVAATIVAVDKEQHCNLRLHLDGDIPDPWLRSRANGDEPGQWSWPPDLIMAGPVEKICEIVDEVTRKVIREVLSDYEMRKVQAGG